MEIARQLQSLQSQSDSDVDSGGMQESDKVASES